MEYVLILSVILAFALNILNRYKISKFLKIIDYPDKKRKIHKSPIPLNGGSEFESIILYIDHILNLVFGWNVR